MLSGAAGELILVQEEVAWSGKKAELSVAV